MLDKLNSQAVKAILAAEEESRRLGYSVVDTEQLLLGLMTDSNSETTKILGDLGINHQSVRRRVTEILGRRAEVVGVETPFTPQLKELLDHAWQESELHNKNCVTTKDLLAAFCRNENGIAWQILSEAGINAEKLKERIRTAE